MLCYLSFFSICCFDIILFPSKRYVLVEGELRPTEEDAVDLADTILKFAEDLLPSFEVLDFARNKPVDCTKSAVTEKQFSVFKSFPEDLKAQALTSVGVAFATALTKSARQRRRTWPTSLAFAKVVSTIPTVDSNSTLVWCRTLRGVALPSCTLVYWWSRRS